MPLESLEKLISSKFLILLSWKSEINLATGFGKAATNAI